MLLNYNRKDDAALEALDKAAGLGHLHVVKFIVQHAREHYYAKTIEEKSKALSCAITGEHTVLVEFLLALDGIRWDLVHAFVAAVNTSQKAFAKSIYEVYPQSNKEENIIISLASNGHTDAVKYLYKELSSSIQLLSNGFISAATHGKTDMVAFLLTTNRLSPDTIGKGFVVAAKLGITDVVNFLWKNSQISSGSMDQAFVSAVDDGKYDMLPVLDKYHRVSAEAVLKAFAKAVENWSLPVKNVKYMVDLLFDEKRVSREMKHQAFVHVTRRSLTTKFMRMLNHREQGTGRSVC